MFTKSTVVNATRVAKKASESEVVGLGKELGKAAIDQVAIDLIEASILQSYATDKICEGIDGLNEKTIKATEKVAQFNESRQDRISQRLAIANSKLK